MPSLRRQRVALICWLLLSGPAALAQASAVWVDPPESLDAARAPESEAPPRSPLPPGTTAAAAYDGVEMRAHAARDLAYAYLSLWSTHTE